MEIFTATIVPMKILKPTAATNATRRKYFVATAVTMIAWGDARENAMNCSVKLVSGVWLAEMMHVCAAIVGTIAKIVTCAMATTMCLVGSIWWFKVVGCYQV